RIFIGSSLSNPRPEVGLFLIICYSRHYLFSGCSPCKVRIPHSAIRNHLITLSALASTLGEIVRPICFAVLRLMISAILSTPCAGKSLGLTPVRIRWTYFADRRPTSWWLTL